MERVVVVGAGLAGLRACEGLRARSFAGEIVLVGDESHAPYDRPPLSKQFLAGDWALEKVWLRQQPQLDALGLELRRGPEHRAESLDVEGRAVTLASGERIAYDGLVLATGARARTLPALESLPGAYLLRTIDDAIALRSAIADPGARLLVVGGGFIGMEVAATARKLGAQVTVVEPLEFPLARVLGRLPGRACLRLHVDHGVRVLLGAALESVSSDAGGTISAVLTDGTALEADAVLVGVGAVPNVDWLEGCGLDVGPSGVACDAALQVAPGIVACGDLALWPFAAARPVRLEHRTNAAEQGDHAAATLLGATAPFETVPYVWSDQYDIKIQLLGIPQPDDDCVVVDGREEDGRFVAVYGRAGVLSAVVGLSMPRVLMRLRSLLTTRTPFDEALRFLT
ncbi:MAG: NAD(P)/FAD-dependent oxidoreductase [Acidimicrobiales bacterium]|jgi:3-phenylpropionate/trans-cinnamate dioxygenase ferredoxin reductase subunit